jgi:hypothetical protein
MVLVIERLVANSRVRARPDGRSEEEPLSDPGATSRFSADKRPLKTNAAVFPHRRGNRHTSAGFYFEISGGWVWAGGGVYMPERRRFIASARPSPVTTRLSRRGRGAATAGDRGLQGRDAHARALRVSGSATNRRP